MTFTKSLAVLIALAPVAPALAQGPGGSSGPPLLMHGNYCGPGNNAPARPVDALDAACARHDACTPTGRPGTRSCNERLRMEAEAVARDPRQPDDLRALSEIVAVAAVMMPSAPENRPAGQGIRPESVTPASHRPVSGR